MTARAVLALGANLGDRHAALQRAVAGLRMTSTVVAVSGVYETAPVGGPDQPDFLNAAVLVETALSPTELLAECRRLEDDAGRVRTDRWGPRSLDVDVVVYDDVVSADDALTLPHPRAHERAFVLTPWLDVEPLAELDGIPLRRLLADLDASGVRRTDLELVA